jgi:catechol 2,3-dioxygenase-like lactoylglutathione lyase family enzyme
MERSKEERPRVAKIRHIALRATDVEAIASFFVNVFGMTIAYRRKNGSIDLSDGTINLAILPLRLSGQRPGFDHIGFAVEDEDEACQHLEAAGAHNIGTTVDPHQVKFRCPEGFEVEVGEWSGAAPIK